MDSTPKTLIENAGTAYHECHGLPQIYRFRYMTTSPDSVNNQPAERATTSGGDAYMDALFAAAARAMYSGVVIVNSDMTIIGFNQGAEEIFGYDSSQVSGRSVFMLVPPERRQSMKRAMKSFLDATNVRGMMSPLRPVAGVRADGTIFTASVEYHKLDGPNGPVFAAVVRDITELHTTRHQILAERETARRLARENEVLVELVRTITGSDSIDDVFDQFAEQLKTLLPFDTMTISMCNVEADLLSVRYASGSVVPPEFARRSRHPLRGTLSGWVLERKGPVLIHAADGDHSGVPPGLMPMYRAGVRSSIGVPLNHGLDVVGVLQVHSTRHHAYTSEQISMVERVAQLIAGAIKHDVMIEQLRDTQVQEREQRRYLDVLNSVTVLLSGVASFEESASEMIRQVAEVTDSDWGVIWTSHDNDDSSFRVIATYPADISLQRTDFEFDENSETYARYVEQFHSAIENITSEDPVPPVWQYVRDEDVHAVRAITWMPIMVDGKPAGGISLLSNRPGHFNPRKVRFLENVSSSVGNVLHTRQILEELAVAREIQERQQDFISIASHELRTPMTAILGFTELMLSREVPEDSRHQWLTIVNQESRRLTTIIEDMLSVTRLESGVLALDMVSVDLSEVIDQAIELIVPVSAGHEISVDIAPNVPPVSTDKQKLIQVMYNLLTNAIKYSPSATLVNVEADFLPESRTVEIRVRDYGIGIPEDEISKLFTLFHRVQNPETRAIRGTGIGLYIVKGLIESMGGEVGVESKLGEGSTFSIRLPAVLK